MTLNITIIGPERIHQSADFRISKTERDADGNWIELQPNSAKIVRLHYEKWFGLMTYCGIGLWNGKRTDQHAVEWLADLAPNPSFRAVVERIRVRGSSWIGGINRGRPEPFSHSFAIAGFEDGVPIYAIVSNAQSLTEDFPSLSPELLSEVRVTKDLHLLITGIRGAVAEQSQERLRAIVRSGAPANVIRHEMAEVNRIASESEAARNGISPACLAHSMDKYGAGQGEVHGEVPGPLMPQTVLRGVDMGKIMAEILKKIPGARLVQSAYATTQSSQEELREDSECELHVTENESTALEKIETKNDTCLFPQDINDREWIVGHGFFPFGTPLHAFVMNPAREIKDLGTFGGPSSHAVSVNAQNQVVGSAQLDHQVRHAFLWDESAGMRDLGTLGGTQSTASCINDSGHVVGASSVNAGTANQENQRAFLWSAADGMLNLGSSFESWSEATAINVQGIVIGRRQRGPVICGFAWSRERGVSDIVGPDGRPFYPCAINDDSVVVGEGDDSGGIRRTFLWTWDGGLRQLGAPDDFHPSDIDAHGNVIGNIHSHPWQQPGVYDTRTDKYANLPIAYKHQTSVKAINQNGVIIGEAHGASAKHVHPLIWRIPR